MAARTRGRTGHAYHASAHRAAAPAAATVIGPAAGGIGTITGGAAGGGLMYVPGDGSEPAGFGFALTTDDYGFAPGDDTNPLNGYGFNADPGDIAAQTYGGSGGLPVSQSGDASLSTAVPYANAKRHRFHAISSAGSADPAAPGAAAATYTGRSAKRRAMDPKNWFDALTLGQKVALVGGVTVVVVGGLLYWSKHRGGKLVVPTRFGHLKAAARSLHSAVTK
jgi:hypothetical protein